MFLNLWNDLMIFFIMCVILGVIGLIMMLDEKFVHDDEEDETDKES